MGCWLILVLYVGCCGILRVEWFGMKVNWKWRGRGNDGYGYFGDGGLVLGVVGDLEG